MAALPYSDILQSVKIKSIFLCLKLPNSSRKSIKKNLTHLIFPFLHFENVREKQRSQWF